MCVCGMNRYDVPVGLPLISYRSLEANFQWKPFASLLAVCTKPCVVQKYVYHTCFSPTHGHLTLRAQSNTHKTQVLQSMTGRRAEVSGEAIAAARSVVIYGALHKAIANSR